MLGAWYNNDVEGNDGILFPYSVLPPEIARLVTTSSTYCSYWITILRDIQGVHSMLGCLIQTEPHHTSVQFFRSSVDFSPAARVLPRSLL
jgi:hypothetical protein